MSDNSGYGGQNSRNGQSILFSQTSQPGQYGQDGHTGPKHKFDSDYYDRRAAEIAASFTYDNFSVARSELFAHMRIPSVTIRYDSVTFNTACINGLEDAVYIQIMVSQNQKRIAIRKSNENDKDSIRWCMVKGDKRKSRKVTSRDFSRMIYDMMNWNRSCRYKAIGYKIFFEGEYLYVFELKEYEVFHELPKRTKEEREELENSMSAEEYTKLRKREAAYSRKAFYPDDVEGTFGVPVNEHENQPSLGDPSTFRGMNEFMRDKSDTTPSDTSATSDIPTSSNPDQVEMNSQESSVEPRETSANPAESLNDNAGGAYGYHNR